MEPMPPCAECGKLSPFHALVCSKLPLRQDILDELRAELQAVENKARIYEEQRDAIGLRLEKTQAEVGDLRRLMGHWSTVDLALKAQESMKLQVRDQAEHIAALEESLKDVLDISEVEGAVNTTVMESAKLIAARSLLQPGHRWSEKRVDAYQCPRCGISSGIHKKDCAELPEDRT